MMLGLCPGVIATTSYYSSQLQQLCVIVSTLTSLTLLCGMSVEGDPAW